jgi:hypothetical protein
MGGGGARFVRSRSVVGDSSWGSKGTETKGRRGGGGVVVVGRSRLSLCRDGGDQLSGEGESNSLTAEKREEEGGERGERETESRGGPSRSVQGVGEDSTVDSEARSDPWRGVQPAS